MCARVCGCDYCQENSVDLQNYERYLKELTALRIDNSFDIPYFAGYSRDGKVIYIDNDVPRIFNIGGKDIDLHISLGIHEYVEKVHVDKGYTYPGAHEIATKFEKMYVLKNGISWDDYDREVGKLMHANWISRWKSFPPDLDMTPYQYARDQRTLSKMRHYFMK